jgi:hypothetical protein
VAVAAASDDADVLWWKGSARSTGIWSNLDGMPGDELLVDSNAGVGTLGHGVRVERRDGSILWQYPSAAGGMMPTLTASVAGDLDGDAQPDVAATGQGELLTLKGRTGAVLSRVAAEGGIVSSDRDFDGDGIADILLIENGRTIASARSGADLSLLWSWSANELIWRTAVGDADGNGTAEVAFATGPTCDGTVWKVRLLNGRTGLMRWSVPMPPDSVPIGLVIGRNRVVVKAPSPRPSK